MLNFLRRLLGLPIKPSLSKVSEEVRQEKEADMLQGLVVRISESALEGNSQYRFPFAEIGDRKYAHIFVKMLDKELKKNFSNHFLVEVEQLRDNINVEWGEHIDARYSVL